MNEFQEIAHSGGKIELLFQKPDSVSLRFSSGTAGGNRMFNRRHVLTHNGGRIDQKYLENTNDKSVRLNQKIIVGSSEIRRLIPLLRTCAQNLFQSFESIA
jgi:hypothetical protein